MRFLTHRQGKQVERGAVLIKAGLTMYDFFSRDGGNVPRHSFVGRKKALAAMPDLRKDIKYAATYFDASVHNPERLTLDVLRDGHVANPAARAANYVSAIGNSEDGVLLRDELTGDVGEHRDAHEQHERVVRSGGERGDLLVSGDHREGLGEATVRDRYAGRSRDRDRARDAARGT